MRVAIVTWITYNNYGTQLQAFALQQYICKMGLYCEIIYDKPIIYSKNKLEEKKSRIDNSREKKVVCKKSIIDKIHIFKKKIINIFKNIKKSEVNDDYKFNLFKKHRLKIRYICNSDEYEQLNKEFDYFICGSDQIWSPLEHNFKGYYFLDFVKKTKIAYAASIGTYYIPDEKMNIIKKYLSDFKAISVRENYTAEELSNALMRNVEWVLDPTLLFDQDFWGKYSKQIKIKERYILCYFLENKKWYFKYATSLGAYLNLKIIIIPNNKDFKVYDGCYKFTVGPEEFVGLIANANFILTDSYHGSIFSILFHKPFICYKRFSDNEQYNQNIRIDSLFKYLNIYDRVVIEEKDFNKTDLYDIEYRNIDNKLSLLRTLSSRFLNQALNN